jgi:hypothetical protein
MNIELKLTHCKWNACPAPTGDIPKKLISTVTFAGKTIVFSVGENCELWGKSDPGLIL